MFGMLVFYDNCICRILRMLSSGFVLIFSRIDKYGWEILLL